jgi:hypothetical protein
MSRMLDRNRIFILLLPTICLGLTACATTGAYEDSLNSWKGSSDATLIKTWGPPTETFNSNGHTFLVYQFSRTKPLSVMGDPTGGHGDYMKSLFCTTIFDVSQGQVQDWAIKGNDCKDVTRPLLWKTAF